MIFIFVREAKMPIGRGDTDRGERELYGHTLKYRRYLSLWAERLLRDSFRLLLLLLLLLVFRAGRLRSGTPKNRGKNCIRKGIVTQCHTRPHVHAHKRTLTLALILTGSTRVRERKSEGVHSVATHPRFAFVIYRGTFSLLGELKIY